MIRAFQEEDLDQIVDIWLNTNLKAHNFISAQYWEANFEAVREMLPQAEVYVYEDENGIQGFVGLNEAYIAGIFVRSEVQSRGIGRQLIEYIKGVKKRLSLCVYQKNVRAVMFYQRENFKICGGQIDGNTGEMEYRMEWTQK